MAPRCVDPGGIPGWSATNVHGFGRAHPGRRDGEDTWRGAQRISFVSDADADALRKIKSPDSIRALTNLFSALFFSPVGRSKSVIWERGKRVTVMS